MLRVVQKSPQGPHHVTGLGAQRFLACNQTTCSSHIFDAVLLDALSTSWKQEPLCFSVTNLHLAEGRTRSMAGGDVKPLPAGLSMAKRICTELAAPPLGRLRLCRVSEFRNQLLQTCEEAAWGLVGGVCVTECVH